MPFRSASGVPFSQCRSVQLERFAVVTTLRRPNVIARLASPAGILLDFGGVIVESHKLPDGIDRFTRYIASVLARGDYSVPYDVLSASLRDGLDAMAAWRDVASRRTEPREMTHREAVFEFLAARLPAGPRALLTAEASVILAEAPQLLNRYEVRPGILELLGFCTEANLPVGIVSNATSGQAHRRILSEFSLTENFAVQVYSDEVGIGKPHPEIVRIGARALGLEPADVWYVGDTYDRDVVAGQRSGVAATIVTKSKRDFDVPPPPAFQPDAVLESPEGILDLLRESLAGQPSPSPSPAAPSPSPSPAAPPSSPSPGRAALLIDHGGVISLTQPNPSGLTEFAAYVADRLARVARTAPRTAGPTTAAVEGALASARASASARKSATISEYARGERDDLPEMQPETFFESVADILGFHDFFRAEAHHLNALYARARSARSVRPGILELFEAVRGLGMSIVVVSNTVSGNTVRHHCERHGLAPYIAAYVCSDETNVRKPAPEIFEEALTIANADPARTWFLGDKPVNDAEGSARVGIAHRVLITGGSTSRAELELSCDPEKFGSATVVDSPIELKELIVSEIGRN